MLTVLLALGTAFGLCMLVWLFYGWLLLPMEGQQTVSIQVSASGNGTEAEQTIRALRWLISSGLMRAQIEIIDTGLTESGMTRMARIARFYPGIHLRKE